MVKGFTTAQIHKYILFDTSVLLFSLGLLGTYLIFRNAPLELPQVYLPFENRINKFADTTNKTFSGKPMLNTKPATKKAKPSTGAAHKSTAEEVETARLKIEVILADLIKYSQYRKRPSDTHMWFSFFDRLPDLLPTPGMSDRKHIVSQVKLQIQSSLEPAENVAGEGIKLGFPLLVQLLTRAIRQAGSEGDFSLDKLMATARAGIANRSLAPEDRLFLAYIELIGNSENMNKSRFDVRRCTGTKSKRSIFCENALWSQIAHELFEQSD